MKNPVIDYIPGILLFLIALATGIYVHGDYGVGWDEPAQRLIGAVNYNYVFSGDMRLFSFADKEYGAAFELPLMIMERWGGMTDEHVIYPARHLITHIFFLLGALSMYILVLRLYGSKWLAAIAFLMLVCMPRIYAHSFFNSKDVPFLSAILIALMVSHAAWVRGSRWLYLIAGIAAGGFTGIRIMGIVPVAFLLAFPVFDFVVACVRRQDVWLTMQRILFFMAGFCLCLYIVWPFLWPDPIAGFVHCIDKMAHKEPAGSNLFGGVYVPTEKLPASYLPVWFGITVPPVWLMAALTGIVAFVVALVKERSGFFNSVRGRSIVLYLLCFLMPAAAVILLHSVIYDEWRHLYFIYPGFVLIAIYGIYRLHAGPLRRVVQALCFVQTGVLLWFMVQSHPHQQVYFNELVSHRPGYLRHNYEMDYWGVSTKQALQRLLDQHPGEVLDITNPGFELYVVNNVAALPVADRERIHLVPEEQARYLISCFRYHPQDYPYRCIDSIVVGGNTICATYVLR